LSRNARFSAGRTIRIDEPAKESIGLHFVEYCQKDVDGSLMESISQLGIDKRQGFIEAPAHLELYQIAERVARMLSRLRASLSKEPDHH
jgi:hypothetical protein